MESTEKKNEQTSQNESDQLEGIIKSGSVVTKNSRESIHTLSIIGQIEGHYLLPEAQKATKYEHIIPLLVAIEESDEIEGLLIVLNTMGGDVEAGLAIAEMIASMTKPTVSLVLGGGHSIGVPLAASAKRSFIVPSAPTTLSSIPPTQARSATVFSGCRARSRSSSSCFNSIRLRCQVSKSIF